MSSGTRVQGRLRDVNHTRLDEYETDTEYIFPRIGFFDFVRRTECLLSTVQKQLQAIQGVIQDGIISWLMGYDIGEMKIVDGSTAIIRSYNFRDASLHSKEAISICDSGWQLNSTNLLFEGGRLKTKILSNEQRISA